MHFNSALATVAFFSVCFASMQAQGTVTSPTLANVRAGGALSCGVIQEDAEYSTEDDHGSRGSFDGDLCKAFSVAVMGESASLKIVVFLDSTSAMDALRAGKVEVIASISADFSHATSPLIRLTPPVLYDGIGFLVPRAAKIEHAPGLAGHKVCFLAETNVEVGLQTWLEGHRLDFLPFPFQEEGEMEAAYITKNCTGLAGDMTRLVNTKASFGSLAKEYVLLPEVISNDPLASATRVGDEQWSNIIMWVVEALIAAEEQGVTASNAGSKAATNDAGVEKLLGRTHDFGAPLGLENDWAVHVLKATGNYGEIYNRAFGPGSEHPLSRGLNRLSVDGGLLHPLPLK